MSSTRLKLATLSGLSAFFVQALALACSVCGAANEENKEAFVAMTVFMTATPLFAIGGFVWWLRKNYRTPQED